MFQIRSFASELLRRGRDPATIISLRDLVEIEAFKEGLKYLINRKGGKITSATSHLARSLKAIARHHVGVDGQHLDKLGEIVRRLERSRPGLTTTNRPRLRQLEDPQNLRTLLRLPQKLMGLAARNAKRHRGTVEAQMAVATEILTMAPIRIANLSILELDRQLVRRRPGDSMHIVLEGDEVKNHEPLDYPLPPRTVELIDHYLRRFRPLLAPAGSTTLFPGRWGGPKVLTGFAEQASGMIHRYTGMRISPTCSATSRLSSISTPTPWIRGRATHSRATFDQHNGPLVHRAGDGSAVRHFDATSSGYGMSQTSDDRHASSRSGPPLQEAGGLA